MGLNPGDSRRAELLRQRILDDNFNNGSPYYGMYHCGYYGVPIEDCLAKCQRNNIMVRKKDIEAYNDGAFKRGSCGMQVNPMIRQAVMQREAAIPFDQMKLSDFPRLPINWVSPSRRFFPCTQDNRPMMKWGWSKDYKPKLMTRKEAEALSPCRWVGQNILYQRFIVLDIDGRGHGADDLDVIEFGSFFKDETFSVEDPMKPGSFHLYFETDRLIPVRHFGWAKIDLMGNAVNAAVYFKNKIGNNVPMMKLDEEIWHMVMQYQKQRKENSYVS